MCRRTSKIAQGNQRTRHDFPLNAQIPRLRIGWLHVERLAEILAKQYERHIPRQRGWKRISTGVISPGIVETSGRARQRREVAPWWLIDRFSLP